MARAPTLREALRALGGAAGGKTPRPEALGGRILELFATFAQVRQGAIFLAAEPDGPLSARPAAHLGPAPELAIRWTIVDPGGACGGSEVVAFDSAHRRDERAGQPARWCWRRRSRTSKGGSGACWP